MYTITYTIGGTTYTLNGYDTTTGLTFGYGGDSGFGLAPLHRITQRGPAQQGDSDIDFRLDPRVLQLPLFVQCDTLQAYYTARKLVLGIFTPSNSTGILTVTLPDNTQRSIYVHTLGGLAFDYSPNDGYMLRTIIQLRADDPTWFDPNANTINLSASVAGTPTPIPLVVPITMGATLITGSTAFVYDGSWIAYPVISATGSITNLQITNLATGLFIAVNGVIPAGRTWTFNLSYGYKSVVDDLGVNQIANITSTSSLNTFAILNKPSVVNGTNTIQVSSTAAGAGANVSLSYFSRYIGI